MSVPETSDYRVRLDIFTGPLDLLLYLVKRHELEILDLPMAKITNQFAEYLEVLQVLDLDLIGDFVVMASTLVEIKSRMVLPRVEEEVEVPAEEEDPRSDLVRQLIEYKKFKDAAKQLDEQAAAWQERFPRLWDERPVEGADPAADRIKEVELWDLVSALSRVLRRSPQVSPTAIIYDDTPISVYVQRLYERVLAEGRVPFSSCFAGTNSRSKIVGIFLAILELLRHYHLRAEQPMAFHEIWVLPPLPDALPPEFPSPVTTNPDALPITSIENPPPEPPHPSGL